MVWQPPPRRRPQERLSTTLFEEARSSVARFVGCADADNVVFVRNTTEAANLLAVALPIGTRVLCSPFEHHANLLPWRQHRVTHLPFTATAADFLEAVAHSLEAADRAGDPFSLVAITGASNVTGEMPPVADVARLAHDRGVARLRRCRAAGAPSSDRPPRDRSRLPCLLRPQGLRAVRHRSARRRHGRSRQRVAAPSRRWRGASRHARRCRLGPGTTTVRGRYAEPPRGGGARGGVRRTAVTWHGGSCRPRACSRGSPLGRAR